MVIDGKENDSSWQKATWSELFIDIEGKKKPPFKTQVKIVWDTTHIYILAQLEDPHVWGNLKQRDTLVYNNNAFEIFIDPDGDTHNYYEYQINALNTVWDLFLSKPYRNKPTVLSSWECKGLQTAIDVRGTLNNATDIDKGWTVEIAIPWSCCTDISDNNPTLNKQWRINFSRVYWDFDLTEGNYTKKVDKTTDAPLPPAYWVWSPHQEVNLHQPEKWGYVFFSSKMVGSTKKDVHLSEDEYIKWYLYKLYRELINRDNPSMYWETIDIEAFTHSKKISGEVVISTLERYTNGFTIWSKSPFTNNLLTINKDGKFDIIENMKR